ncbi:MAG: acyl--CoA ligase, partial [Hyphomicrobiales bacterium]|nr:acyl--CoA ligase [Hyphomicrobiales bacterium]
AQINPDRTALVLAGPSGTVTERLSFAELDRRVHALTGFFGSVGLKPDNLVLQHLPFGVDALVALFAASRAGLIVSPVSPLWGAAELSVAAGQLAPKLLLTTTATGSENAEVMRNIAVELFSVRFVCAFGDAVPDGVVPLDLVIDAHSLTDPAAAAGVVRPGNAADHIMTLSWSGDDGSGAKLLPRSHNHWISAGVMHLVASRIEQGATIISPYHPTGLVGLSAAVVPWLLSGGTLILQDFGDLDGLAALLGAESTDHLLLPAGLETALARRLDGNFPTLATVHGHGRHDANPPASDWDGAVVDVNRIGDIVAIARPRRAGGGYDAALPLGQIAARIGKNSVGFIESRLKATPRKVSGENGRMSVTEGMVALRGPVVPDTPFPLAGGLEASPRWDAEGYLDSGICGRLTTSDPTRFISIGTNPERSVVVGGLTFALGELDGLYSGPDTVAEAAAVAIADPVLGSRLGAVVVAAPGAKPVLADLITWLEKSGVDRAKLPVVVAVVAALPRDEAGSVLRRMPNGELAAA